MWLIICRIKDNTNKQGRRSAFVSKTKQVEYVEAYRNSGLTIREFAKGNYINPQEYLSDVLKRLPAMTNQNVEQLLPSRWLAERQKLAS